MTEKSFLLMIMLVMIITGAMNTLGSFFIFLILGGKWQDDFEIDGQKFKHPIM